MGEMVDSRKLIGTDTTAGVVVGVVKGREREGGGRGGSRESSMLVVRLQVRWSGEK